MVLKIDLLPPGVKRARTNKKLLFLILVLLVAGVLSVGFWATSLKTKLAGLNEEYNTVKAEADEVRAIETETGGIKGRLQPIADKVRFIAQADECGYPYWERFYEIAEYIYGGAELRFFGIMAHAAGGLVGNGEPEALYHQTGPAGGTDCAFGVTVKNANEFARFILNLIRCPEVSNVRMTGDIPSGRTIAAAWPAILTQWNQTGVGSIPTLNVEGLDFGGGAGGGAAGGGMGPEAGGMPGAEMGGGMPGGPPAGGGAAGPEMGGMPGGMGGGMAGGRGGGGTAAQAVQPRLDGSIDMLITCELSRPIMVPSPAGAGGGGGGAAAGGMPGGGMPGGGMPGGGMPGGGGPPGGGGMPGGGGPPGGDAGAGAPPGGDAGGGAPPGGGGGGEDAGGGGGGEE